MNPKEKEITAYHEAGHALVAASLKDSDPVHKVSIISRGRAGGYTLKLPLEEQRLKTRAQFLSDIAVALGGYVAEQLVFGDISTGSSSDLQSSTKLARALVTQYGMSEKLGPQTFGESHELVFLGKELGTEKNYSDALAAKIDEEVKLFVDHAHSLVKKILTSRKSALDAIAKALMDKEELEKDEFDALMGKFKLRPMGI